MIYNGPERVLGGKIQGRGWTRMMSGGILDPQKLKDQRKAQSSKALKTEHRARTPLHAMRASAVADIQLGPMGPNLLFCSANVHFKQLNFKI